MRFIELHEYDSNQPIIINVSRLDLMFFDEDKTILKFEGSEIGV